MGRLVKYGVYTLAFFLAVGLAGYVTTFLVVKARPETPAPDLGGLTLAEALSLASQAGMNLRVAGETFSEHTPKGQVLTQDPAPGLSVRRGRLIRVTLSLGARTLPAPELIGLDLAQARAVAAQAETEIGPLSQVYSASEPAGRVLAQTPDPGQPLPQGQEVGLLVSLGPRPQAMLMPRLTGLDYSLALLKLEEAGLTLAAQAQGRDDNWPPGAVIGQEPEAGMRAASGQGVTLTLNAVQLSQLTRYELVTINYMPPQGFFNREIVVRLGMGEEHLDLYQGWHPSGRLVRLVALVPCPAELWVLEDQEIKAYFQKN